MAERRQRAGRFPPRFFDGVPDAQIAQFREFARIAGFNLLERDDRWTISEEPNSSRPGNIVLRPLQDRFGRLRRDAEVGLTRGETLLPQEDAERAAARFRSDPDTPDLVVTNSFEAFAQELVRNANPIDPLRQFLEKHEGIRVFALHTSSRFRHRDLMWRMMARAHSENATLAEMTRSPEAWPTSDEISGSAHIFCTHLIGPPLFARSEPIAAAFTSIRGNQLVVVGDGAFRRPFTFGGWPVATSDWLTGRVEEVRAPWPQEVSLEDAVQLLSHCVERADRLVEFLNSIQTWTRRDGDLKYDDRMITWSTIDLGFNTVAAMAKDWQSTESVWTAFRALDVLQGLWEGTRPGSILRRDLYDPAVIREHGLSVLGPQGYQEWASGVIDVYEQELGRMYPATAPADRPRQVAELRNLIHGTGTQRTDPSARTKRLQALRGVGEGALQLLQYVAAIWWSGVLMSPPTHAVPHRSPLRDTSQP